jgi:hypothetical protein
MMSVSESGTEARYAAITAPGIGPSAGADYLRWFTVSNAARRAAGAPLQTAVLATGRCFRLQRIPRAVKAERAAVAARAPYNRLAAATVASAAARNDVSAVKSNCASTRH